MQEFIKKNYKVILALSSFLIVIFIGIYVNLLTTELNVPNTNFIEAVKKLNLWNILLIFSLFLYLYQIRVSKLPYNSIIEKKKQIIEDILRAACISLIYPNLDLHIRAVITICDYVQSIRITKYSYNIEADPERTAIFPIDFGVTGEALMKRAAVAKPLSRAHKATYPENVKDVIADPLKCVLAVPIFDSRNERAPVIGILAFDSFENITTVGFSNRESYKIAQMWADLISKLITIEE